MASLRPPPDHLGRSTFPDGRPFYTQKPLSPPPPTVDQRRFLVPKINAERYHKMGVETLCPSCGLIEPYRHGQFSGGLHWDQTYSRDSKPARCYIVCFHQWCLDHIPPEIGTATLIRLDQGTEPQPPWQPKHAAQS
jgi:hypothetical protein